METKKSFLYLQVYNEIKERILDNDWQDGMQLPTEFELMDYFNVSRDTIRKALHKLSNEGYIYRQAGKGTFVRHVKSRYKLTILESFSEQMIKRGLEPSSEIISIDLDVPAKKIAKFLELDNDKKAYKLERIRKANDNPMAYEITYIPESICPNLEYKVDSKTSLYELYEKEYNLKMSYGDIYLEAEICNKEVAKRLNIEKNPVVLKMNTIVYLDNKKPLYYVICYYIGSEYMFFASMPRTL